MTKVFIGSTSRDLEDYRKAAIDTCLSLDLQPVAMEHFPAMGVGATEGSKRKVDEADLYVGIFAYRYGYIEDGYDKSVTEIEFDYAGERGMERLCFLIDPKHPWPRADDDDDLTAQEKLRAFKKRIDKSLIRAQFTTVDDFTAKLILALVKWHKNSGQSYATSETTERYDHNIVINILSENIVVNVNVIINKNLPSAIETQALVLFYGAFEKWKLQDFDGAIEACSEAIKLVSSFAWAYNSRGAAKRAKGDYDGAFSDYDEAIRLDPLLAEAYHNKGIAHHFLGNYDNAIDCFSKAIEIHPSAESYSRRGITYYRKGDNNNAIIDYGKAIENDPTQWMAYTNRGSIYYEQKNYDRAIEDYNAAIAIASKLPLPPEEFEKAYLNRAWALLNLGKLSEALNDTIQAVELNPGFADAYELQGRVLAQLGRNKQALELFDKAIELMPSNSHFYDSRGWTKYEIGNLEGALQDYNIAIDIAPSFAEAYNNRGIARKDLGDLEGALEDYTLAIHLNHPRLEWPYNNRSIVHMGKGEFWKAIIDCTVAINMNPQSANVYINRSNAYHQLGMVTEAIADLEKYLELGGGEQNNDTKEIKSLLRELKATLR
ncbi:MAG: tetratricopeptide repeat protein [Anaerolineae bacterium]|nr:tetratricopeptide repeat protein [Anaerolineae bacterium]